jgi:hypothetical protein
MPPAIKIHMIEGMNNPKKIVVNVKYIDASKTNMVNNAKGNFIQ